MFESENTQLKPLGVCANDTLVTVRNFSNHSIRLPSDTEFEALEPYDESIVPEHKCSVTCAKVQIDGPGYHDKDDEHRSAKLLKMIDLSNCNCSVSQLDDFKALFYEYSSIFELDRSELGHCNLVKHTMDTGESAPLRQQPY